VIQAVDEIDPDATVITLAAAVLEALARSTKDEVRMRMRAQIVLDAADGTPLREIGRMLDCTTATVSKWRVPYSRSRLAGLDETGDRGAEAKYGPLEQRRILAMLDKSPPAGYSNWTAPLLARALGDIYVQNIWRFCVPRRSTFPAATRGARAGTLISSPTLPTSLASIWPANQCDRARSR
jgi:transposase